MIHIDLPSLDWNRGRHILVQEVRQNIERALVDTELKDTTRLLPTAIDLLTHYNEFVRIL